MSKSGNLKLGLFVTGAIALLVAALLSLGVLDRFTPRQKIETYFTENIQGLVVGAPVRFRGIKAGAVDEIGLGQRAYSTPDAHGLIRVVVSIDLSVFDGTSEVERQSELAAKVDAGLRFRLATTGLGGPTYIEADFLDAAEYPALEPTWEVNHIYVPSAISTAASIIDSLDTLLRKIDESSALDDLDDLVAAAAAMRRVLESVENDGLVDKLTDSLTSIRELTASVEGALDGQQIGDVLGEARQAFTSLNTLVAQDGDAVRALTRVETMAVELESAAMGLEQLANAIEERDLIARAEGLVESLQPVGPEVGQTMDDVSGAMSQLDRVVTSNEAMLSDAIRSLRDASMRLNALLEDIRANPSQLLSDPPPTGAPIGGGS